MCQKSQNYSFMYMHWKHSVVNQILHWNPTGVCRNFSRGEDGTQMYQIYTNTFAYVIYFKMWYSDSHAKTWIYYFLHNFFHIFINICII